MQAQLLVGQWDSPVASRTVKIFPSGPFLGGCKGHTNQGHKHRTEKQNHDIWPTLAGWDVELTTSRLPPGHEPPGILEGPLYPRVRVSIGREFPDGFNF